MEGQHLGLPVRSAAIDQVPTAASAEDGEAGTAMGRRTDREILGVTPAADPNEVRRAFRRRAVETHPDRGGDPAEFRQVREAYERLTRRQSVAAAYTDRDFPNQWIPDLSDIPPPGFEEAEGWRFFMRTVEAAVWPLRVEGYDPTSWPSRYLVDAWDQAVIEVAPAFRLRRVVTEVLLPPAYRRDAGEHRRRVFLLEPTHSLRLTYPVRDYQWVVSIGVTKYTRPEPPKPPMNQSEMFFPAEVG